MSGARALAWAAAFAFAATTTRAQTPPAPNEARGASQTPAPQDAAPGIGEEAPAGVPPAPVGVGLEAPQPTAEDLYHAAFEALAHGDRDLAASLLREIVRMEHPLAGRARELLVALAAREPSATAAPAGVATPEEVPAVPGGKATTGAARAELVFFQTVHGLALGAETCAMIECDGTQPWVLSLMLGAGAGFGTSWALSTDGVTPGLARATTDATLWGATNGALLVLATGATEDTNEEGRVIGAHLAVGQLVGLGLGALVYSELRPTAGQVSLTASGGMWTLAATGEFLAAVNLREDRAWGWILLGAGNVGVVAGGLFARAEPMTAGRVLLIDAGGLLGTLTGMGVSALAQGNHVEPEPTFGVGLAGTLLGLGLGYYLTSGWDEDDMARNAAGPRLALAPLPGGAGVTFFSPWD